MKSLVASLMLFVVCVGSVGTADATRVHNEQYRIAKDAYMRTYEAKVCIDATANNRPETAMGFCYSWYVQALDAKEKATAYEFVKVAADSIEKGIASERD